jgi:hypothetical protein
LCGAPGDLGLELGNHSRQIAALRVGEVQSFMLGDEVGQRLQP